MARKTTSRTLKERSPAYAASSRPAVSGEIYRASITSKGQIVIPADLRRKYGITTETRIVIYEEDGRIVLLPVIAAKVIEELRGSLAGTGTMAEYLAEKAKEIEREDADLRRPR